MAATRALRALQPPTPVPVGLDVGVDATVFLASLVSAAVVTVLMGVVPAIRSSRDDLITVVRDASGTTGSAGGARLRTAFVVTQVALSFALAGVAGLLARSASAAGRLDLGFDQRDTWAMSVDLETRQYSPARGLAFERGAREALRSVPGVLSVTAADIVPVTLSNRVVGLRATDRASAAVIPESPVAVHVNAISPGHFATLRIPLIGGRDFDERDVEGAPAVAIVNETLARRFWPGESAIGKRVRRGTEAGPEIEVVGVARDSKYSTPGEEPKAFAYRPLAQAYTPRITFLVRTVPGVDGVLEEAQRVVHRLDPDLAVYNADALSRLTAVSRLPARVAAGFAMTLAAAALGLAGFGTFSLLAFVVSTRSREFGIRMALGAAPGRLLRDVLRHGLSWLVIGPDRRPLSRPGRRPRASQRALWNHRHRPGQLRHRPGRLHRLRHLRVARARDARAAHGSRASDPAGLNRRGRVPDQGRNKSSIRVLKTRAIAKARGRLGSYLPFSIEITVCRDTPRRSPSSCWDHPFASRTSRSRLFIRNAGSAGRRKCRRRTPTAGPPRPG